MIVDHGDSDGLEREVACLAQRDAYPEPTRHVECIETHMSWVFLTDSHAYKLKKPLRTHRVDRSALATRRVACENEVRLNRRLAPDVYLGVVPLLRRGDGMIVGPLRDLRGDRRDEDLEPEGVVDWLVAMRRLDRRLTLESRIAHDEVTQADILRVTEVLARFYDRAEVIPWTGATYRARLEQEVIRYRRELDGAVQRHALDPVDGVSDAQLELLRSAPDLFDARTRRRAIVDAHGDLRPEHVFLEEPEPVIIDCLEFDRELRLLDRVSELAFLCLECVRSGAPAVSRALMDAYGDRTGDRPPNRLWNFYQSHHACIRALIALWHLDDPRTDSRPHWVNKARDYLHLASRLLDSTDVL